MNDDASKCLSIAESVIGYKTASRRAKAKAVRTLLKAALLVKRLEDAEPKRPIIPPAMGAQKTL